MAKFIAISLLAYVAAFFCFTPVEATDRKAVEKMISVIKKAGNSVSESTIDDALLHIHERIDTIMSDLVLPMDVATIYNILHERNDNMSDDQRKYARSYHQTAFDELNRLFIRIADFMNKAEYLHDNAVQQILQEALALVAPPLKWHHHQETKYRQNVKTHPALMPPSLPPYHWEDVGPTPSRFEKQYRAESPNNPASTPVPIFTDLEFNGWLEKIEETIAGYQRPIYKKEKIDYHRNFHTATAKSILSHDQIRPDVYKSTAEWGWPYKYEDLHRLASEYQIWQSLLQAHTKLIIAHATYDLERVRAYRLYKPDERKDQVATIIKQLKRFIRKFGDAPNTAQTSAVPDCSNVHDVGTSTAPSEQTGPVLSYFGGAILEPPTGYVDPIYRHDGTTFGYPAFDHGGPAGASSDRDSPEGPSDVGCFIRNYHHPDY
ncbi:hypothetical protein SeLEV6574_g03735 [Synchytrium endobioticum]|uniref:Uncharacterized protein n=1 Tax=Synchytrium endobioticum TaxID=286115 RepID=A0A507D2D5_9FUNG|nr:hypothetical protein SeLEV6574_g03735 [Synchytrium endobioticum]